MTVGPDTYFLRWGSVWSRPDNRPPLWANYASSSWDGLDVRMIAGDAQGDLLVGLDIIERRLYVFRRSDESVRYWHWNRYPNINLPLDIATDGANVFLAEALDNRIHVANAETGRPRPGIVTHDRPRRVDVGPSGDVFVLGAAGWLMRYTPSGQLVALWPLPEQHRLAGLTPTDLAVGDDDRVYVSYVAIEQDEQEMLPVVSQAGIWVFGCRSGSSPAPAEPPRPGGCLPSAAKGAVPSRVRLGDQIQVRLSFSGQCPRVPLHHDIVIVLDTSRSMTWQAALERAKAALVAIIERLDLSVGRVGVVTFSDDAAVLAPLTGGLEGVRSRLVSLGATGDTNLARGIDLATRELTSWRANFAGARSILIVTDGQYHDDPLPAVASARAQGIGLFVLVYPNSLTGDKLRSHLEAAFGTDTPVYYNLTPEEAPSLVNQLRRWNESPGLFQQVEIGDELPANMRLVPDSARPPAIQDGPILRWSFGPLAASESISIAYSVEPLEVGVHPTNRRAWSSYRDILGYEGEVAFPVPMVEVVPPSTATATPAPSATSTVTVTPAPSATSTATVTPAPSATITIVAPATPGPTAAPLEARAWFAIALREPEVARRQPADLVLAVDCSSSMIGAPLDAARESARTLVALAGAGESRLALVSFHHDARVVARLGGDAAPILAGLDRLDTAVGTRIDRALFTSAGLLSEPEDAFLRHRAIILLSDGQHVGDPEDAVRLAAQIRTRGISIYACDFSHGQGGALLARLTGSPALVLPWPAASQLAELYDRLAPRVPCEPASWWGRRCGR